MIRKNVPILELSGLPESLRAIDCKSGNRFVGQGVLSFLHLPRICEEIRQTHEDFNFQEKGVTWAFESWIDIDSAGIEHNRIKVTIQLDFPLECQRCMQPYDENMLFSSQFVLFDSEDQVEDFPMDIDEEDALLNSHSFDLITLIEDEILLHLPFIPKHDAKMCHSEYILNESSIQNDQMESKNPFTSLKNLKFDA
jgi:uncharacterized protein